MIEFRDVHLRYPYEDFELFKGVNFTLTDGCNTVIADRQSGKTSLCRLLIKDISPTSGQIFVNGAPLQGIANANLDILYLPGKPVFFERRSILYNIEYPLRLRKVPRSVRRGIALHLCDSLSLDPSVGICHLTPEERKRVAVARGLTVPRSTVLWDDFFTETADVMRILPIFDGAAHVFVTSDISLALGNTVVLDGGVTAYQGDAEGAARIFAQLDWQAISPRS